MTDVVNAAKYLGQKCIVAYLPLRLPHLVAFISVPTPNFQLQSWFQSWFELPHQRLQFRALANLKFLSAR